MSEVRKHRKPTLEALRALMVLQETGSVTATAKRLKLTQPVVTRKLEIFTSAEACGAKLLRRPDNNALELTEAARDVLPEIRDLIQRYDQLLEYLQGKSETLQTVRIGVGSFVAQHYLPRAIARIRNAEQDIAIETQIVRGEQRIAGIVEGRFDLAIVSHNPDQIEEQAARLPGRTVQPVSELLASLTMCVIAKKNTDAAKALKKQKVKNSVPLENLTGWELVGLDSRSGIRQQLEQQLARPDELHFLAGGGWLAAKEFARQGVGVAIVPLAVLTTDDRHDFVIRRLSKDFAVAYYLIHRKAPLSEAQEAVRQALHEAAQAQQKEIRRRWRQFS